MMVAGQWVVRNHAGMTLCRGTCDNVFWKIVGELQHRIAMVGAVLSNLGLRTAIDWLRRRRRSAVKMNRRGDARTAR